MTIHTRVVTSIDGLRSLGPSYDAMVLAAGDAGLFYQLEWLERAWPYYHARLGGSMRFVIAERQDRLVALAPLVFRTEGWIRARRRVLAFLGGTWDELDNWMPAFLFVDRVPEARAAVMAALAQAIAQQSWDLLDLRFVRDSCPSHQALRARFPALRVATDPLSTPRALMDQGWVDYWTGRTKRLARMLERGRSRASQDGLPLVHEVTHGVPPERREEAATIHRARQQQIRSSGRARSSPFDEAYPQQVLWSLMDWAASRGHMRVHWLRLGDHTAAYVFALHHAGTTFAYLNAIDPAFERYHPGSLILASMIEREATEYGARVVDMMVGANLTKSLFATEELVNSRLSVVNSGLRSKASDVWIRSARALVTWLRR